MNAHGFNYERGPGDRTLNILQKEPIFTQCFVTARHIQLSAEGIFLHVIMYELTILPDDIHGK